MLSIFLFPRHGGSRTASPARPAVRRGGMPLDGRCKGNCFSVTGSSTLGGGSQSVWQHPNCSSWKRCKVRCLRIRGERRKDSQRFTPFPRALAPGPQPYGDGGLSPTEKHQRHRYSRHCHGHHTTDDWKHSTSTSHDRARHSGYRKLVPPPRIYG